MKTRLGIVPFIRANARAFETQPPWVDEGSKWLERVMEECFRVGTNPKIIRGHEALIEWAKREGIIDGQRNKDEEGR
jgi:hypothetical protein